MAISVWLWRCIGRGHGPQAIEGRVELTAQTQGIEALIERLEVRAGGGREHAGGAQALEGGLGPIVDAPHAGAVAVFAHELLHGLEEVDLQAGELIDAPELVFFQARLRVKVMPPC